MRLSILGLIRARNSRPGTEEVPHVFSQRIQYLLRPVIVTGNYPT